MSGGGGAGRGDGEGGGGSGGGGAASSSVDGVLSALAGSLRRLDPVRLGVVPRSLLAPFFVDGFSLAVPSGTAPPSSPPAGSAVGGSGAISSPPASSAGGGGGGVLSLLPSADALVGLSAVRSLAAQAEEILYHYLSAVAVGAALGAAVAAGMGVGCAAAYGLAGGARTIPGLWRLVGGGARRAASSVWGRSAPSVAPVYGDGDGAYDDAADIGGAGCGGGAAGGGWSAGPVRPAPRGRCQSSGEMPTDAPPPRVRGCADVAFLGRGGGRIAVIMGDVRGGAAAPSSSQSGTVGGRVGADGGQEGQCRECLDRVSALLGKNLLGWPDVRRITAHLVRGGCDARTFRSVLGEYPLAWDDTIVSVVFVQALEREGSVVQVEALALAGN